MDDARSQPEFANPADTEETVTSVRERIERSWDNLRDALDGIPEARLTEPGVVGQWSIKDLLGHVAFWDGFGTDAVRRYLAGATAQEVEVATDPLNEREAATRAGRSVAEQRAEMAAAHERVLVLVSGLRPSDLEVAGVRDRIAADTYEHYDEHADEIRAWRKRVGI